MKQAKTKEKTFYSCTGCEAVSYTTPYHCDLGYENQVKEEFGGVPMEFQPCEPCPKPKTLKQYQKIVHMRKFS